MSQIHWLSDNEVGEWDAFVSRHPLGLVYHLSSWRRVLESAFGHIRGRFLVLTDGGGQIQAGLPVYTVKSWLLGNRLVSVPFATVCDPLVSTKEEFNLLWGAIQQSSEKHRNRRIEIRTRRISTDCIPVPLTACDCYKHHYLPLDDSPDALFRSFHKTSIRQRVNKAVREGVTVEERGDEQSLRTLHNILTATRRKHLLPPMPFRFFQSMVRFLGADRASVYLAIQTGEPVGALLALKFKDLWTAEYSGTVNNANPGVSPVLYWDAIQRAKSHGAAHFSFGRTKLDNRGLLDFKRRWTKLEENCVDFVSCEGINSEQGHASVKTGRPAPYEITLRLIMQYAPATVQKLLGDFCYRHLG